MLHTRTRSRTHKLYTFTRLRIQQVQSPARLYSRQKDAAITFITPSGRQHTNWPWGYSLPACETTFPPVCESPPSVRAPLAERLKVFFELPKCVYSGCIRPALLRSPSDSQRWTHSVCVLDLPGEFTSVSCAPHFLVSYVKNINWLDGEQEEADGAEGVKCCPFWLKHEWPYVRLHLFSHRHISRI